MDQERFTRQLQSGLDRIARRRAPMPPPQVLVRAPGLEFRSGEQARPFHAASVGKVMTATLVAMLIEQGRFEFGTPIGTLLPSADVAGLPAAPGVDVPADVRVEHLLTHTSGLPDYFDPPRGSESPCSWRNAAVEPDRRWTPADLLDVVRQLPPIGHPGERFGYSDTAYVLLGRIIEEASGEPLEAQLRTRIFEPSGMVHSATPYSSARAPEDVADLDIAPFWAGNHELSRALSMSLDWAGGGVVAPPEDLVRFQQALHGGRLVSPPTLERLVRPLHRMRRGIHYGTGTVTVRWAEFTPPLLRGLPEPVGGVGFFATHMFYYPRQDAHVVLNFHSNRWMSRSFRTHIRIARLLSTTARPGR